MASRKKQKPLEYEHFTQIAFAKKRNGDDHVGICVRQYFYPLELDGVTVGQEVKLRQNKGSAGSFGMGQITEYTLDGEHWHYLRASNSFPI
jgi:hypothetical protein